MVTRSRAFRFNWYPSISIFPSLFGNFSFEAFCPFIIPLQYARLATSILDVWLPMRFEKATAILELARELAGSSEGLTLDEISSTYVVSRRTAERMRDAVEAVFGPLAWDDDGKKRRFRIAARGLGSFATSPTAEELAELENSIRHHEAVRDPVKAHLLRSLSNKVKASLREHDRRRLSTDIDALVRAETFSRQVGPRPFHDATIFSALRQALLSQKVITFLYPFHDGQSKRRTVVPYGLLFGPRYYLVGAEVRKSKPVLFRLDRISDLEVTEAPGAPPPDFDLDEYAAQSFGIYQEEPQEIELRFSAENASEAKSYLFHPTQSFEAQENGELLVRFTAGGLLEVARELMTWGDGVEVLKPERLKKILSEEVDKLYRHHVKRYFHR